MGCSTPDVNIPHHLYPFESLQNTELLQTSEQGLTVSNPPDANVISAGYYGHLTELPIAQPQPVLATAYYSKFTNFIEYGGYLRATRPTMRSSAAFDWVVNFIVVCMLKPNNVESYCL